jgi:hypothetical protein
VKHFVSLIHNIDQAGKASRREGQSYLELVLLGLTSRAGVQEIDSENLNEKLVSISSSW